MKIAFTDENPKMNFSDGAKVLERLLTVSQEEKYFLY
jgi:hypothetical protein